MISFVSTKVQNIPLAYLNTLTGAVAVFVKLVVNILGVFAHLCDFIRYFQYRVPQIELHPVGIRFEEYVGFDSDDNSLLNFFVVGKRHLQLFQKVKDVAVATPIQIAFVVLGELYIFIVGLDPVDPVFLYHFEEKMRA